MPAERFQHRGAELVAVAGGALRRIGRSVALDGEEVSVAFFAPDCEVDAIAAGADMLVNRPAVVAQAGGDGSRENAGVGGGGRRDGRDAFFGEVEKRLQVCGADG